MATSNLTVYDHSLQLNVDDWNNNALLQGNMTATAWSQDGAGVNMIAAFEHKTLPIYGTQFHSEKPTWEWANPSITHHPDAITLGQSLSNFFVSEVRKNLNVFNATEYGWLLIYNYDYEVLPNGFSESYVFLNADFGTDGSEVFSDIDA
jgi:hypothetical protein